MIGNYRRNVRSRAGFTMMELVITIGVLAVIVAVVLPAAATVNGRSVSAAGRVLTSDLRLARSMALRHNASVAVVFDLDENKYLIEPRNGATLSLPTLSIGHTGGSDYEIDLDQIGEATLGGVFTRESESDVTELVFLPTGALDATGSEDIVVWLSEGSNPRITFVRLRVCWITGNIWTGGPWLWDDDARDHLIAEEP
ncbi:GspH/FimT family pseudopilin [Calycomorphotria hydatis]|uniref:Type II secretion system protein H n=1 Tax=Calycomorphotria hydatis TaxID=2528027 RepID=A0A517TF24_9PLAN|nr:GspH/FimT family pseudopilin [Calycomorphotria hydatis]QDT66974.1 hypothetical protein V22_42460 [Calycomorphotria hydatis]